jgi:hypothetical protein
MSGGVPTNPNKRQRSTSPSTPITVDDDVAAPSTSASASASAAPANQRPELVLDVIPDHLYCPICMNPYYDCNIYQCREGHVICEPCHNKLLGIKKCPECRIPYSDTIRCRALEQLSGKLVVNCPFHSCTFIGKCWSLTSHKEQCEHRHRPCQIGDCTWSGQSCDFQNHLNSDHTEIKPYNPVGDRLSVDIYGELDTSDTDLILYDNNYFFLKFVVHRLNSHSQAKVAQLILRSFIDERSYHFSLTIDTRYGNVHSVRGITTKPNRQDEVSLWVNTEAVRDSTFVIQFGSQESDSV